MSTHEKPTHRLIAGIGLVPISETPPTFGMCLHCGAVEVALVQPTGTRDFSNIGESPAYPTGYGCEACS